MKGSSSRLAAAAIALAHAGSALQLNTGDTSSIKAAAGQVAKGLYVFHNEDATTGQFNQPQPWFWWLSGSGWTGLMDYTVYTKDTTYKADLLSALGKNVGPNFDFVPPEQAGWEANDDLAYWLFAGLTAMEYGFDTLPGGPAWDVIATNSFNLFVSHWNADSGTCNGGLKWQYNPKANGYTYKNAVTNGAFFQTAARLARYTGNQTYADWAVKIWDWSRSVGIVSEDYHVYDGTSDDNGANCTELDHNEWSYNIASYLHGAAHMFNFTDSPEWEKHVHGFVDTAAATFFKPAKTGIMFEQKCEPSKTCTTDQTSFKASLARWMGKTAVLVPSAKDTIFSLLKKSAAGAAQSCVGHGNSTCGVSWTGAGFDGQSDFGVELSALEIIQSLLVFEAEFGVAPGNDKTPTSGVSSSSSAAPTSKASASATHIATPTTVATATTTTIPSTPSTTATTLITKLPVQSEEPTTTIVVTVTTTAKCDKKRRAKMI
ncbi:glycosyl hydrolase family 76-domain-containing protein [Xylaria digitata]|nr:glycosyl hydrolase family 76-domain-containing protein [Xylaria digitata]